MIAIISSKSPPPLHFVKQRGKLKIAILNNTTNLKISFLNYSANLKIALLNKRPNLKIAVENPLNIRSSPRT